MRCLGTVKIAVLCLAACILALPAWADNGSDSVTITASISTTAPESTLRADNNGECWMGTVHVDCNTQMELPLEVAENFSGTVPRSTLLQTSGGSPRPSGAPR